MGDILGGVLGAMGGGKNPITDLMQAGADMATGNVLGAAMKMAEGIEGLMGGAQGKSAQEVEKLLAEILMAASQCGNQSELSQVTQQAVQLAMSQQGV